jgi:hypothetical protein
MTTLETLHNQYWHLTWFNWQMTHEEHPNDVVHLHDIEQLNSSSL